MTSALRGLDPCVHCGFCLQSCPTYLVTGDEADSPRGRIVLMRGLLAGGIAANDRVAGWHLDRCLGCRACEPACPSGVSYAPALEQVRVRLAAQRPIPITVRAVHAVMADGGVRRPLLALGRLARPVATWFAGDSRIGRAAGMVAASRPWRPPPPTAHIPSRPAAITGGGGDERSTSLFTGCIMEGLFGHVHGATERVLRVNGFRVDRPAGQGCCGALHAHAGQHETASELARHNVRAFRHITGDATIVVNAAGCGAMLKEYGRVLRDDPLASQAREMASRVRDVSELLAEVGPQRGAALPLRVVYDPPCHLLHAQRVARPPLDVLRAVPGLEQIAHAEADVCCGGAGTYTLAQPQLSRAVLDRKLTAIAAARPDVVATGNLGCAMQIGAGLLARGSRVPVVHPVELLDASYDRAGLYAR